MEAMSAEVIGKPVTRYYCSVCGRNWAKKWDAMSHVTRGCWDDPDSRHCHTCHHAEGRNWPCDEGLDVEEVAPCDDWERRHQP